MRRYRFFTQVFDAGFGHLREAIFANDDEALKAARQMLEEVQGVDVWDENQRIGLVRRQEAA